MERFVCAHYANNVTLEDVLHRLRVEDEDDIELVGGLYRAACGILRTKTVMRVCYVEAVEGERVRIDGEWFQSRVMVRNLEGIHRVFAYVATCGREVDEWAEQEQDPIVRIWLDMMKEMFLGDVRRQFFAVLERQYKTGALSAMAPGSGNLDTWPIAQQVPLFRLIGGVEQDIGVQLTPSMLMIPNKSVSGIAFPKDHTYVSCALCRRQNCPNRQAPYDPAAE